jgi:hypothetical protein
VFLARELNNQLGPTFGVRGWLCDSDERGRRRRTPVDVALGREGAVGDFFRGLCRRIDGRPKTDPIRQNVVFHQVGEGSCLLDMTKQGFAAAQFAGKRSAADSSLNEIVDGISLFEIGEAVPAGFQLTLLQEGHENASIEAHFQRHQPLTFSCIGIPSHTGLRSANSFYTRTSSSLLGAASPFGTNSSVTNVDESVAPLLQS